jgi:hypothetical protein
MFLILHLARLLIINGFRSRGEARRMKFLCDNERGGGERRSENFLILVCTLAKEAFLGARAGKWRHTRGRIKAAEL